MYGMSLVISIIIPERPLPIIPSPHYIISRIVYRSILLLVAKKHPKVHRNASSFPRVEVG